jgi:integrase
MCSLRQSEIAGLHVRDIDGKVVHVHGARVLGPGRKLVYKSTNKTPAGTREDTMPDYLARRVAEKCSGKGPEDYIFEVNPDEVRKRFQRLLRRNGLPPYTIHSLRHCFAAVLHAQGVPDKYVMRLGGWASDYVLKKIYQYTFSEEAAKAARKANKYFSRLEYATQNATQKQKA